MNKITFCTVCMNRLTYLRETLPVNIADNMHYPGVEFIVLDYNSPDGMEDWAQSNLAHYIESGVLKYYKTYEPEYFSLAHSKNMALKLASGNVLGLIDADNYAGADYAAWANSIFCNNGRHAIVTTLRKDHVPFKDQGGKICFDKDLFNSVQGLDESLISYGMDDVDFVNRLEKAGGKRVFIEDPKYLKYIGHSDIERLKNHRLINSVEEIYLQMTDFMRMKNRVIYLLKEGNFFEVNYEYDQALRSNMVLSYVGWMIKNDGIVKGTFQRIAGDLALTFDNGSTMTLSDGDPEGASSIVNGEKISWKKLSAGDKLYYELVMAYGECMNRRKYRKNDENGHSVNPNGWGKGTVYLNFDRTNPITI
jgi:glycosyltransferase involved in cell wall biosynthesis